jgi:hypothetical protein
MPSDRRDLLINTLLGVFLLAAASFVFILIVAVAWLVLSALSSVADLVLPGVVLPKYLPLFAIYGTCSVVSGVGHLHRRLWRNAFLCLAVVPLLSLIWLADPHSPFGSDNFLWLWMVLMSLFTPEKTSIPRNEFFIAASIAGAAVVVMSGLGGSGEFMRIVLWSTQLTALVLLAIKIRRNQARLNTQDTASSVPA